MVAAVIKWRLLMKKIFYYASLLLVVLIISSCSNTKPNTPSYFGNWTVDKVVGSTPISTSVDDSLIGLKATYNNEKAIFGKDETLKPEYKEQEITKDDFLNEYRTQLTDIGIKANSVKTVEITNGTHAGSFLIIKDDQTMIFLWDGNYYEMKRDK